MPIPLALAQPSRAQFQQIYRPIQLHLALLATPTFRVQLQIGDELLEPDGLHDAVGVQHLFVLE